jgi:hypothetical protein
MPVRVQTGFYLVVQLSSRGGSSHFRDKSYKEVNQAAQIKWRGQEHNERAKLPEIEGSGSVPRPKKRSEYERGKPLTVFRSHVTTLTIKPCIDCGRGCAKNDSYLPSSAIHPKMKYAF